MQLSSKLNEQSKTEQLHASYKHIREWNLHRNYEKIIFRINFVYWIYLILTGEILNDTGKKLNKRIKNIFLGKDSKMEIDSITFWHKFFIVSWRFGDKQHPQTNNLKTINIEYTLTVHNHDQNDFFLRSQKMCATNWRLDCNSCFIYVLSHLNLLCHHFNVNFCCITKKMF